MTYIQPLTLFFLLLAVIGLLRLRKSARPRLLWIAVAGLFLLSWPPADWLFSKPLEIWYPVRPSADHPYQAIVVLSSDVRPSSFDLTRGLPDKDTMERCECAAWLYRQKPVPVLACGGRGRTGLPYSVVMRDLLVRAGVPP